MRVTAGEFFATCRAPELKALEGPEVSVHALDVTDAASIATLREELNGTAIDVLLNNAGFFATDPQGLYQTDDDEWLQEFRVNTLAPMRMAEAFLDNIMLSERKQILNISSVMGSIANTAGGYYAHSATKAGLNASMKNLSIDLDGRGITVGMFHPGWVRTEMGGPDADLSADESVTALRTIFERLTPTDNGKYINYTGEELPW